jgi:RNA polymerase sigma factor for flagellar operon FliA
VVRRADSDDSRNLLDIATGSDDEPHARLERSELSAILVKALGDLPERERHILALYYEQELTLAEIGEVIGVGESRVSQLRTQAIARLRSRLRETLGAPGGSRP